VDDVSWGALALALTALGGIYTWWALRHRGFATAVRAAGITLLPLAAWMTGLLQVFGDVADSFGHWFTRLVFSPFVWLGMVVFVVAVVLIGAGNMLGRRGAPAQGPAKRRKKDRAGTGTSGAVGRASTPDPLIDDEMAEIQAILKKRGIS
jgi:predicted membrane protein